MDDLDFSDLSDDQMLGLLRAALRELVGRSPALAAAAEAATLDEAERARVLADATAAEAARYRAAERERIAAEATARVRAARSAQEAEAARFRGAQAGSTAAARIRQEAAQGRAWLRRAASLVDQPPENITLLVAETPYGRRVLINHGAQRYSRRHLADWHCAEGTIKTQQSLVRRKPELAGFAAEFAAAHPTRSAVLIGAEQDWQETA